jgi:hypothetical protein
MNELETAIRAKYRKPRDVVRALGLPEAILHEPRKPASAIALDEALRAGVQALVGLGQDATLQDFAELIDMLKAGNAKGAAEEAVELAEEAGEEDDGEERDESSDDDNEPGEAEEEEEDMEGNSGLPVNAGEREDEEKKVGRDGGINTEVARLLMKAAKMLMGEGREEHEDRAEDEEIDATDCARAKDEDLDGIGEKPAKDEEPKGLKEKAEKELITKSAMDAAISFEVKAAEKRGRENAKAIREADGLVRKYLGETSIAMDAANADEVYRKAAVALGIEGADVVHASALPFLIKQQPFPGSSTAPRRETKIAQDAAADKGFADRFPALARLSN